VNRAERRRAAARERRACRDDIAALGCRCHPDLERATPEQDRLGDQIARSLGLARTSSGFIVAHRPGCPVGDQLHGTVLITVPGGCGRMRTNEGIRSDVHRTGAAPAGRARSHDPYW
jgi:hypothetical protein